MRIGFLVDALETKRATYTTEPLAMAATNRGREVWFIAAGDFTYDADEKVRAWATTTSLKKYKATATYVKELKGHKARCERITVDDLDILMLRNDPADETGRRAWAKTGGIIFGNVAVRSGVIVLNDPTALAGAPDKMYNQLLPQEVRPNTLISCDRNEIRAFVKDGGGVAILKGFQGTSAQEVFLVTQENQANLNQMIDAVLRYGYVMAQEYLPAAAEGDTRLFMMNGRPLLYRGKYAAFRRLRTGDDLRSNIHAGGMKAKAVITETHLRLAEVVRPKLVQDGMFFVGLDIVGDKLMETNVFSPGGLGSAQILEKVNFNEAVIDALDRKAAYMSDYHRNFANVEMAMF